MEIYFAIVAIITFVLFLVVAFTSKEAGVAFFAAAMVFVILAGTGALIGGVYSLIANESVETVMETTAEVANLCVDEKVYHISLHFEDGTTRVIKTLDEAIFGSLKVGQKVDTVVTIKTIPTSPIGREWKY